MARLMLGVLGAMQATLADGQTIKFRSDQTRALLAFLAVEADRPHRRDALTGLLWPDESEEAARHNLRQALVNLRRTIGDETARPPFLLITHQEIQFNKASDFALDTADFDAYLAECARHRHTRLDNCAICAPRLQQAVDLYRGPFMQEFFLKNSAAYEEWTLTRREAFHQRALEALSALGTFYEQHGNLGASRRCALRALELDPWHEQAHRQMMRAFALEGEYGAALAQYEACRRMLAEEMGVEPAVETRELYEQIRSGKFRAREEPQTPVPSPPIHNLPIPMTAFIGREKELADLARLIADPDCRCITLTGPGGIGKTRLALQAADQHGYEFAQGVAFIPLASVGTLDALILATANGIGCAFYGPTDPKIQLLKYLRDKQMLLILDSVEHLLLTGSQQDTMADLLIEILQQAARVKLLITSRQVLNLQGEWSFEIQGLAVPELGQTDGLHEYSAVTLFVQRARRARPGFELNAEDKTGVLRLCRLVEGLPLAIELAAAWVRTLSPTEIADEIETSLDFLNSQVRDLPERHRSMQAVFDHSWQMLTEEERHVLRRMSVLRGAFTREAAEEVSDATLGLLSSLVTKTLLRRTSEGRYSLHELVRQYLADRLAQMPEEAREARDRHSAFYMDYVCRLEPELKGAGQLRARAALDADIDNIRAGWRWAVQQGHVAEVRKPLRALWWFYDMGSWFQEAEASLSWAIETMDVALRMGADAYASALREYLRAQLGWFYLRRGKLEQADVLLQSSLGSLRPFATGAELADVLYYAGAAAWMIGDYPRARAIFREGLSVAEQFGNAWDVGLASIGMGLITQSIGEYEEAQQHWQKAIVTYRRLGDKRGMASALNFSSIAKRALGANAEAQANLRECLALSEAVGDRVTYGMALSQLGLVTQALGDHAEAAGLLDKCVVLLQEQGEFWSLLHALIGLGAATLSIGDYAASRAAYYEALRMAWERQALPEVLEATTGVARWSAQQGAPDQALEYALFIVNHRSATEQTKEVARRLRAELESGLSPEAIEAIQVRVQGESFEKIIQELLRAKL